MSNLSEAPNFKKRKAEGVSQSLNLDLEEEKEEAHENGERVGVAVTDAADSGSVDGTVPKSELSVAAAPLVTEPESQDSEHNYRYFIDRAPCCPSILGVRPVDDLLKNVASWIYASLPIVSQFAEPDKTSIELEIKLGWLVDTSTDERLQLPIGNDAIIYNKQMDRGRWWFRFVSDMTMAQHEQFNKFLNERITASKGAHFPGKPLVYKHSKEIDYNFQGVSQGGRDFSKLRLSFDAGKREIIPNSCIVKEKIADLSVYCPNAPLDFRISINIETQHPIPDMDVPVAVRRHKDRLSYQHELLRFDLTQVAQDTKPSLNPLNPSARTHGFSPEELSAIPKRHELEIELTSVDEMLAEKSKLAKNQPNTFLEMVDVMLNNARVLAYRAGSFRGPPKPHAGFGLSQ